MNEPNYNETVIIPFLERKCKELLHINLVLEAKLLSETERCKNLQYKIESLQSKIDTVKKKKKSDGGTADSALDGDTF